MVIPTSSHTTLSATWKMTHFFAIPDLGVQSVNSCLPGGLSCAQSDSTLTVFLFPGGHGMHRSTTGIRS
jgi:hypothetical protein